MLKFFHTVFFAVLLNVSALRISGKVILKKMTSPTFFFLMGWLKSLLILWGCDAKSSGKTQGRKKVCWAKKIYFLKKMGRLGDGKQDFLGRTYALKLVSTCSVNIFIMSALFSKRIAWTFICYPWPPLVGFWKKRLLDHIYIFFFRKMTNIGNWRWQRPSSAWSHSASRFRHSKQNYFWSR